MNKKKGNNQQTKEKDGKNLSKKELKRRAAAEELLLDSTIKAVQKHNAKVEEDKRKAALEKKIAELRDALENNQNADGSINIPVVLNNYMDGIKKI